MATTMPDHGGLPHREDDRPWTDPALPTADRVEALLARLTLPEQVAQLSSTWEDIEADGPEVAPGSNHFGRVGDLDETARHGLGQFTRPYGTLPRPALEHARLLARHQQQVVAQSRFDIPAIAHDECLTGFTAYGATIYPTSLGMAATFDPALIRKVGEAIGSDMAEVGVHQGLSPVVDVIRDYRWGRCEETYGEDPYLVVELAEAYVTGLQSAGVYATLKHFAGYSASTGGRNHAPVHADRRELFDVILPPFERLVAAGVRSVMNSYADIDGEAPAASRWLLTEVLRDAWGFEGTVVSGYWSLPFLVNAHRVAADLPDAGALALRAGMDVELPDQRGFGTALVHAVEQGLVDEEFVDRAVRRVLRQKTELGLLDADWDPRPPCARENWTWTSRRTANSPTPWPGRAPFCCRTTEPCPSRPPAGSRSSARAPTTYAPCSAATASPTTSSPNATTSATVSRRSPCATPWLPNCPAWTGSSRRAARSVRPTAPVSRLRWRRPPGPTSPCWWSVTRPACSGSVPRARAVTWRTCGCPEELVEAVLATGRPVVLVVSSGRPYAVGRFASTAAAMVQVFLPGEEGGRAVAQLLAGEANFSGKLPV